MNGAIGLWPADGHWRRKYILPELSLEVRSMYCCSMTSHRIGRSKVPARFGYEWASGRYYTNSLGVNLVLSSMSGAELRVANNAGSDNLIIQR